MLVSGEVQENEAAGVVPVGFLENLKEKDAITTRLLGGWSGVKSGWGEKLGVTPLGGLSDDALPQPIDDMPDRFPGRVGPGQGLWL